MTRNINAHEYILNIVAISSATNDELQVLQKKHDLSFFLTQVNSSLAARFQANCESCLRIVIIDNDAKIRYLAS
jgi:hypothetical protein